MAKYIHTITKKLRYDHRVYFDRAAFSFLSGCEKILDLGCGTGRFISQDPARIKGLDLNDLSLSRCREKGFDVIKGDVRVLPFQERSFQGIHCSHILEHFPPHDVHRILTEMNRILSPGGILVVRAPLLTKDFYSDLSHIRPYNPRVILKYLTPTQQRTFSHISDDYQLISLKWRYKQFNLNRKYINLIGYAINQLQIPILPKTGYLLVMGKRSLIR